MLHYLNTPRSEHKQSKRMHIICPFFHLVCSFWLLFQIDVSKSYNLKEVNKYLSILKKHFMWMYDHNFPNKITVSVAHIKNISLEYSGISGLRWTPRQWSNIKTRQNKDILFELIFFYIKKLAFLSHSTPFWCLMTKDCEVTDLFHKYHNWSIAVSGPYTTPAVSPNMHTAIMGGRTIPDIYSQGLQVIKIIFFN